VNLFRNELHYPPAPAVFDVLRSFTGPELSEYATSSPLTAKLADLYDIDQANIVLGQGAEDILTQAFQQLVNPGERVLIPSASWWYYRVLVERVRGIALDYPVREDGDDYTVDVDELLRLHGRVRPRVILLTTVSNPTGNRFPMHRLTEVLEQCRDSIVVVDDAYGDFCDDFDTAWLAQLTREHHNLLVARTLSKLYGLAGARIGYGVGSVGIIDDFTSAMVRSLGHNRLSEALGVAALGSSDYYRTIKKLIAESRDHLADTLRPLPGVRVFESAANFQLVWFAPELAPWVHSHLDSRGMLVKWLDEPGFEGKVYARISVGTTAEHARVTDLIAKMTRIRMMGEPRPPTRGDLIPAYQLAARAAGAPS
jgi:histidinol-phosphate aminotransferase